MQTPPDFRETESCMSEMYSYAGPFLFPWLWRGVVCILCVCVGGVWGGRGVVVGLIGGSFLLDVVV